MLGTTKGSDWLILCGLPLACSYLISQQLQPQCFIFIAGAKLSSQSSLSILRKSIWITLIAGHYMEKWHTFPNSKKKESQLTASALASSLSHTHHKCQLFTFFTILFLKYIYVFKIPLAWHERERRACSALFWIFGKTCFALIFC